MYSLWNFLVSCKIQELANFALVIVGSLLDNLSDSHMNDTAVVSVHAYVCMWYEVLIQALLIF